MLSLSQVIADHTDLPAEDRTWLLALIREWHLLADTSFSDLILWLPDGDDESVFWAGAQIRPNTGPTALEDDVVGEQMAYDPEHLVTEAFLSQEICETSDNKLRAGIPVDVWAIPIIRHGECIGVVERHTNQMGVRAPGALEDCYLEVANLLSDMLWRGAFPVEPPSVFSLTPKVGNGLVRVNNAGVVSYASPNAMSAYRRMGLTGDLQGENFRAITEHVGTLERVDRAGNGHFGHESAEYDLEGSAASLRLRVLPLSMDGEPVGQVTLCMDITELRERDRQLVTKDATIREIHHRVKNNLQTVAALLRLQSRRMNSEEAKGALKNAMSRVASIAVVHEILSQAFDEVVPFDDVADRILQMVGDVAAAAGTVTARREGTFGLVPADAAMSLSLAITELCQNAVEHGLAESSGVVVVRPQRNADALRVEVIDNGRGLPAGFDIDASNSLGLSIVRTLVADLGGTFSLETVQGQQGSVATITIQLNR